MTPEVQLIRLYQQAARRLRLQVRTALERGALGTASYQQAQLEQVYRELRRLGAATRPLAAHASIVAYRAGGMAADLGAVAEGLDAAAFRFTGPHLRAASAIADNLALGLNRATVVVGRRTADAFRTVALQELGVGEAAGATRREVSAAIERRLIDDQVADALTGFVDAGGRRWQLDVYARMAARTTTREAVSVGFARRMGETGQQLVTISDHGTTTEICKPYEGGTFAMPGETVDGYDTIDELPPFHPNCLHVATAGAATLDETLTLLEQEASRGFDEAMLDQTAVRLGL